MGALADLRAVGVDIVTIGQYLRPSVVHLPGGPLVDTGGVRPSAGDRRRHGLRPRPVVPAHPLELPRPGRGQRRVHRRGLAHLGVSGDGGRRADVSAATASGPDVTRRARLDRVREEMAARGVDALLLSHGADLPWLTGYRAMPLERLTVLVLPGEGEAVLVVPGLEAARVPEGAGAFALRPWAETEDPVAIAVELLGRRDGHRRHLRPGLGHVAAGLPGTSARHPAG